MNIVNLPQRLVIAMKLYQTLQHVQKVAQLHIDVLYVVINMPTHRQQQDIVILQEAKLLIALYDRCLVKAVTLVAMNSKPQI